MSVLDSPAKRAAPREWSVVLANRLAEARKVRGITQTALAKAIGIKNANVSSWEAGDTAPSVDNLNQVANILGVSIDWLLGREAETRNDQVLGTIGGRIRACREALGLSQEVVAAKLGFEAHTSLSKIENDKAGLQAETLASLADIFGVTTDFLLGREDRQLNNSAVSERLGRLEATIRRMDALLGRIFNPSLTRTKDGN